MSGTTTRPHRTHRRRGTRRRVLATIVAAGLAVTAGCGSENASDTDGETLPVEVVGALPAQEDDPVAGLEAPRAEGTDFDGTRVELVREGEPTIIGFFAHWCPHCQAEVAEFAPYLSGGRDDVRVVAVSTGVDAGRDNYPPSEWLLGVGWPTEILVDDADNSVAQAYGLTAFPYWAVVAADGTMVTRGAGAIDAGQFEDLVALATAAA